MANIVGPQQGTVESPPKRKPTAKRMGRFNRWDTPWLNSRLIAGLFIITFILLLGVVGRLFWDLMFTFTGSSPHVLPPVCFSDSLAGNVGTWEHPLGTEASARDMLALLIVGAPNTFLVGVIAYAVGEGVGIILGFSAGYIGGKVDAVIRVLADVSITIPALLVLFVIQSIFRQVELTTIALLVSLFAWPQPTRHIRAQVLSMRESGYVQMAKVSGASTFDIMFREIMPNLIPYLFASFIGNAASAILNAVTLEVLGLV